MPEQPCLFCRIVSREIPAAIVAEDADVLAFNDIHPQAPTHVLVIPKIHLTTISELTDAHTSLIAKLVLAANRLAQQTGIAETGFRLVLNCGAQAGQSVWHVHLHLLGGRPMAWPPG